MIFRVELGYDTDSFNWNEDYYNWEHREMPDSIGNPWDAHANLWVS